MRILWISDSPTTPSGFGNVTKFVCAGLTRLGHDVSTLGWQHRRTSRSRDFTVYATRDPADEPACLARLLRKLEPDVLVTLADSWRISYVAEPELAELRRATGTSWVFYCPIDSDLRRSRLPAPLMATLAAADLPVAMSRYGRDLMRANGLRPGCIRMAST
jgi:hypothetical protein